MSGGDDWYEKTFGVKEKDYLETQGDFAFRGNCLVCLPSHRSFQVGTFKDASVAELRQAVVPARPSGAQRFLTVKAVSGEVTALQGDAQNRFATFQVSAAFNYLGLTSPNGTPEHGITSYHRNRAQGGACAISCAAGALYRNYFVPIRCPDGSWQDGQTAERMLNGLAPLLDTLNLPADTAFKCQGGYTLATDQGLRAINDALSNLDAGQAESLVKVGVHEELQVTSTGRGRELCTDTTQAVNQVFAPACSISWNPDTELCLWEPLVRVVLHAAYEATLWAALRSAQRHWGRAGSARVFLTMVGCGGFGTPAAWACDAMDEALWKFRGSGLEVAVVLYNEPVPAELQVVLERYREPMRQ